MCDFVQFIKLKTSESVQSCAMAKIYSWVVLGLWTLTYCCRSEPTGYSACRNVCCQNDEGKPSFCTVGYEDKLHGSSQEETKSDFPFKSIRAKFSKWQEDEPKYGIGENGIWVSESFGGYINVCSETSEMLEETVQCEPLSGAELNHCSVDRRKLIYDVTIRGPENEDTPGDCQLGENYGYNGTHIWVKENCRANFSVNLFPVCTEIKCSSRYGLSAKCYLPPQYKDRTIASVMSSPSSQACSLGDTYTKGTNFIKVNGGCLGEFNVCVDRDEVINAVVSETCAKHDSFSSFKSPSSRDWLHKILISLSSLNPSFTDWLNKRHGD
ncbi:hypothetical protein ScPMuIL_008249 [Solemya velum]